MRIVRRPGGVFHKGPCRPPSGRDIPGFFCLRIIFPEPALCAQKKAGIAAGLKNCVLYLFRLPTRCCSAAAGY